MHKVSMSADEVLISDIDNYLYHSALACQMSYLIIIPFLSWLKQPILGMPELDGFVNIFAAIRGSCVNSSVLRYGMVRGS